MSGLKSQLIDEILTPVTEERITAALATLDLGSFNREDFTELVPWTEWFGTTGGPYPGVSGAAMTEYRLAIIHSPAVMLLFADASHHRLSRFYGAAPYDAAAVDDMRWQAFTHSPAR
jgi:hypothetical protein